MAVLGKTWAELPSPGNNALGSARRLEAFTVVTSATSVGSPFCIKPKVLSQKSFLTQRCEEGNQTGAGERVQWERYLPCMRQT